MKDNKEKFTSNYGSITGERWHLTLYGKSLDVNEVYNERLLNIVQLVFHALAELEMGVKIKHSPFPIITGGGDTNITTVIILVVILLLIFHVFFMFVVKNTPISLLITVIITWIGYNYVTF